MRLVRGTNLAGFIGSAGPLEPARALDLLAPAASALDAAHAAGLIHRDVKPANFLLAKGSGRAPARISGRFRTDQKGVGTGGADGHWNLRRNDGVQLARTDPRGQAGFPSDLYALGCVAYACLTGSPPFVRDDQAALLWAHLAIDPPPVSAHSQDLTPADAVIARCLAKSPQGSFRDVRPVHRVVGRCRMRRPTPIGFAILRVIRTLNLLRRTHTEQKCPRRPRQRRRRPRQTRRSRSTSSGPGRRHGPRHRRHRRRRHLRRVASARPGPQRRDRCGEQTIPALDHPRRRKVSGSARATGQMTEFRRIHRFPWPDAPRTVRATHRPADTPGSAVDPAARRPRLGRRADRDLGPARSRCRRNPRPASVDADRDRGQRHTVGNPANRRDPSTGAKPTSPVATTSGAGRCYSEHAGVADRGRADPWIRDHGTPRTPRVCRHGETGFITVVDTFTDRVSGRIPVKAGPPQYISMTPDGSKAFVSIFDSQQSVNAVTVLDTRTSRVLSTISRSTEAHGPYGRAGSTVCVRAQSRRCRRRVRRDHRAQDHFCSSTGRPALDSDLLRRSLGVHRRLRTQPGVGSRHGRLSDTSADRGRQGSPKLGGVARREAAGRRLFRQQRCVFIDTATRQVVHRSRSVLARWTLPSRRTGGTSTRPM